MYSETELSRSFWGYLHQMLTFYCLCAKEGKGQIFPHGGPDVATFAYNFFLPSPSSHLCCFQELLPIC